MFQSIENLNQSYGFAASNLRFALADRRQFGFGWFVSDLRHGSNCDLARGNRKLEAIAFLNACPTRSLLDAARWTAPLGQPWILR
jgi:hypothetical protein